MNQEHIWKIESLWEKYFLQSQSKQTESFIHLADSFFTKIQNLDDLEVSEKIAFTDNYGSYPGLTRDVVLHKSNKPFYIFDNHNKALMAFLEIKKQKDSLLNIVHIDAHPDSALAQHEIPDIINQENIVEVYEKSRISDFLDVAAKGHLIKSLKRIISEEDFLSKNHFLPIEPFTLSLDIDIFGPEGAFTSLEHKIQTIAHYWNHAEAITIATSPGFINQEEALIFIKIFIQHFENSQGPESVLLQT